MDGLTKFSLLKRKGGTTHSQFLKHWRSVHVDVLINQGDHKLYNKTYVQNDFAALPGTVDLRFDGAAQMTPRASSYVSKGFQADPRYAQYVRPDENLFLDVASCEVLYCETSEVGDTNVLPYLPKLLALVRPEDSMASEPVLAAWGSRLQQFCRDSSSKVKPKGCRLHRVLPESATSMADGAKLAEPYQIVEEILFSDIGTLHAFLVMSSYLESFRQYGAKQVGMGSHAFIAYGKLIYSDPI